MFDLHGCSFLLMNIERFFYAVKIVDYDNTQTLSRL